MKRQQTVGLAITCAIAVSGYFENTKAERFMKDIWAKS